MKELAKKFTPTALRKFYNKATSLKQSLKTRLNFMRTFLTDRERYLKSKWARDVYTKSWNDKRESLFLSSARFCWVNRPVDGYYFEFACFGASTMRMAWNCFHHLFDWDYVAFDSFQGFPEIDEIDKQEIWDIDLTMDEEWFIKTVTDNGMPREKLAVIKGFYDESLTDELAKKLLPKKAAVILIDCDLYKSTVPVLKFIIPFLQKGTIIIFDDWNSFWGDPARGERLAFSEFREQNPGFVFEQF